MENNFEQPKAYEILESEDLFKDYSEIKKYVVINDLGGVDFEEIDKIEGIKNNNDFYAIQFGSEKPSLYERSQIEDLITQNRNESKFDIAA